MNLSLEGKKAMVCGSTQGIGWAIAQELALLGATCTLVARNEEKLKRLVNELNADLQQAHDYLVADFTNPVQLKSIIETYIADHTVHILINNTGGPNAGPVMDAKEEQFIAAFQQHLICNHILATTVATGMKEESYGRIVNIVSTSVKIPLKNLGVSNTIRGAVASWAKTLSNELAPFGITVNNILPGATRTQRLESIIDSNAKKSGNEVAAIEEKMQEEIPMKRFGEAHEIAAVAAFLCSPAASYITGTSIPVDGGRTGSI